jgi:sortase A
LKIYRSRRFRRYQVREKYPTRRSWRYDKRRARTRRRISTVALIGVLAGLGLVVYTLLLGEDSLVQRAVSTATDSEEIAASAPKGTTLYLTIPKMARVEDLPVYDAPWDSEAALDVSASHLDSSGFPWQEESNVYVTGHRMGFPGTRSFLVFYDLDALENGDEIFLTDSDGTRYTYEVFNEFVSDPFDWSHTEPVPGKNIVTLQTCTLPDYTQRLMVQGELKEVTLGASIPTEGTNSSQEEVTPQAIPPEGVGPQPIPQEEIAPEVIPQEADTVLIEPVPV